LPGHDACIDSALGDVPFSYGVNSNMLDAAKSGQKCCIMSDIGGPRLSCRIGMGVRAAVSESKAMKLALTGLLLGGLLLAQTPASAEGVAEPEGYRGEPYRSPTPDTLRGARVLSTGDAEAIWKSRDAIFVDVLPHAPRPAGLPPGTIWREKPRRNIPGSIWLPDTGYDGRADKAENYLRNNLARVTGGDKARLLVIYCLRDCWMSWNAAKRILAMGYTRVAWYPDGTDGWDDALLPLEESRPVPQDE